MNVTSMENATAIPPQAEEVVVVTVLVAILTSLLALLVIVGNGLIIVSVTVVKKLRQPANFLIVSLALSDFLVGLVVLPLTIVYDIAGKWVFGPMMCDIHVSFDVICCTASIMNLCMISIDRYLMITRPMTYPKRRTGRLMVFLIGLAWLVSCLVIIPALFGFTQNVTDNMTCLISQEVWFSIYSTVCAFYIPLTIMLCMYWKIFVEASRFNARHKTRVMSYMESQNSPYSTPKISSRNVTSSSSENISLASCGKDDCVTNSIKSENYVIDSSEQLLPIDLESRNSVSNNNDESVFDCMTGNLKYEVVSNIQKVPDLLQEIKTPEENLLQVPKTAEVTQMNKKTKNCNQRIQVRSKSDSSAQPYKQTYKRTNGHLTKVCDIVPAINEHDSALPNDVSSSLELKPTRELNASKSIGTRVDAIKVNGVLSYSAGGFNKFERRTRHSIFSGSSACCSRPKFCRTTSAPARSNTIGANGNGYYPRNMTVVSNSKFGSYTETRQLGYNGRRSTMFNQIKRRVSLATTRDRMRNVKATRTLGIIVGAFTFCWLPFFIVTFLRPFICENPESQDCIPLWLVRLVLWLGYLNSALNPLIYIGFSPDLRSTFQFLICCKCTNVDRRLAQNELRQAVFRERRASSISRVQYSNDNIL